MEDKETKQRSDKGKKRGKYKNSGYSPQYLKYMRQASVKQIEFALTEEQIDSLLNLPCIYCGTSSRIGINRNDNSEGYISDNCSPCCQRCATMKWDNTPEQFLRHINKIISHFPSRQ